MVLLLIVGFQATLTLEQTKIYEIKVYDCSDMSKDCEKWFEEHGADTRLVSGECKDNNSNRHMWCLVDFGWRELNYESTKLIFLPEISYTYKYCNFTISEGNYKDGVTVLRTWNEYDGYE